MFFLPVLLISGENFRGSAGHFLFHGEKGDHRELVDSDLEVVVASRLSVDRYVSPLLC